MSTTDHDGQDRSLRAQAGVHIKTTLPLYESMGEAIFQEWPVCQRAAPHENAIAQNLLQLAPCASNTHVTHEACTKLRDQFEMVRMHLNGRGAKPRRTRTVLHLAVSRPQQPHEDSTQMNISALVITAAQRIALNLSILNGRDGERACFHPYTSLVEICARDAAES